MHGKFFYAALTLIPTSYNIYKNHNYFPNVA